MSTNRKQGPDKYCTVSRYFKKTIKQLSQDPSADRTWLELAAAMAGRDLEEGNYRTALRTIRRGLHQYRDGRAVNRSIKQIFLECGVRSHGAGIYDGSVCYFLYILACSTPGLVKRRSGLFISLARELANGKRKG